MDTPVVKKAYYDSPNGQVHYRYCEAIGSKKVPVLLLHMSAASSLYYEPLMKDLATCGHDCYAPDMPGFGRSYDEKTQPPNTGWYVELFMILVNQLGLEKYHLIGHHSGGSLSVEMSVLYPEKVLSLTLVGPAVMSPQEQNELLERLLDPYNKPVPDGSHLSKTWKYLTSNAKELTELDVEILHEQALDQIRAWQGRIQIYSCVFTQPIMKLYERVTCPIVTICSANSMLVPYLHYVKELQPNAKTEQVGGGEFEVLIDHTGVKDAWVKFTTQLDIHP